MALVQRNFVPTNIIVLLLSNLIMKTLTFSTTMFCLLLANHAFSQFAAPPTLNPGTQVTGGSVGIGTNAPAAKLDVLSTGNQLRLSNTASIFSDIQTTSAGYLYLNPNNGSAGRIGLGIASPLTGFHSNMGIFRISDPGSTTRGFQVTPNYTTPNGDVPAGTCVLTPLTTSGEGLSFASSGSGASGVKIGTYAYNGNTWLSMWETQNVGFGSTPSLRLVRTAGNVTIGTMQQTTGPHTDAKLSIDGKTVTRSLYVTMSNWADYVFAPDYKLPNLYDIEKYYLAHKHLPEIPSEKDIIENGIDVGEMNKLLLKKIEEMTIMMVEQERKLEALKTQIESIKTK